ncbi:hypothetical protein ACHAWF_008897 [Thalassiosira exigua]
MKPPLLLALIASSALPRSVGGAIPTTYVDIHLVTSFASSGNLKSGYLFRVEASQSDFAPGPPRGPKWATRTPLTSGAAGTASDASGLHAKSTPNRTGGHSNAHPSHRLLLPPASDPYLCNESDGKADYRNPAGNAAAGVFDSDTLLSGYEGQYVLVPRGGCTFEAKARSAQRLGAAGAIVRNTLDSRYGLEDKDAPTSSNGGGPDWSNTKWPVERRDYECGTRRAAGGVGWRAEVEASKLDFSPAPYDGSHNDLLLSGPAVNGNLCAKQAVTESFEKKCPSERCLLTGRNASDDGTILEACCAWDTYLRMSTDGDDDGDAVPQEEEEKITIPALFVTMEGGEELYDLVMDAEGNSQGGETVQFISVVPYGRWYPPVHFASVLLWALAVFTVWISTYASSKGYRSSWKKISKAISDGVLVFQRNASNSNATGRERVETEDTVDLNDENVNLELSPVEATERAAAEGNIDSGAPAAGVSAVYSIGSDEGERDDFVGNPGGTFPPPSPADEDSAAPRDGAGEPTGEEGASSQGRNGEAQRVNLQSRSATPEMQNLELNSFHAVFFVLFATSFLFVLFFFNMSKIVRVLYGLAGSVAMARVMFYPLLSVMSKRFGKLQSRAFGNLPGMRGIDFKWIDVAGYGAGFGIGIAWIILGLSLVRPMTSTYYWIVQDIMGVCFCILILGLIHINNIMVASILLCIVFVYDIFYVLISPYFLGSSVMVDVATGAAWGIDVTYCEKYTSDGRCRGSLAPLPMMLVSGFDSVSAKYLGIPQHLSNFAISKGYSLVQ